MNNLQELDVLNSSLSDYGLCPTEWQIIEEEDWLYKIQNKEEPHFFFRGKIKYVNGHKKWRSIRLAGL